MSRIYVERRDRTRESGNRRQMKRRLNVEEEKLRRGEVSKIAQACLREILDRERIGNTGGTREETRVQNGMQGEGRGWKEIEEAVKERQGGDKIEERGRVARYNSWYRVVKEEGDEPECLKKM